ncbi:DNA-directed RNA polymerase subunit delta [Sporolactobacillus sp. Y61]|uniref:RNAP delta factor n=1 Tax=Sporolactobacillus sp. Y61 TaxID=3160863 RepID=A0AAU8IHI4_9BACL
MFSVGEHVAEKSKVDQLYDILAAAKEPKSFYEMTDQILKRDEVEADHGESLARLYTTLTLDGRFLNVGHNLWALRNWYPIDQREDDVAKTLGDEQYKKNKIAEDGFDDYDEDNDDEDEDDSDDVDDTDEEDYGDQDDDDVRRIKKNAIDMNKDNE